MVAVDSIPVAHTPPGGYGSTMPPPVLAGCDDAIVDGAPDLRGTWRVAEVRVDGVAAEDHPALGQVQRVEQAGDRLVVTAAGVIHDMRCDGVLEHGVHDVGPDYTSPIHVTASYEEGVHVLRPDGMPGIEVTRRIDGDRLLWQYGPFFTASLERID